jgi:type III restriction enzyme
MEIKFEKGLDYQRDAINSVVELFAGQEICRSNFTVYSPEYIAQQGNLDLYNEIGFANKLQLTESQILTNLQHIQLKNGMKPSTATEVDRNDLDFSVEMETGTGKTYVYLRSIMEMNRKYGFTKFIIVVPSVPIREGVYKSLQITEKHFKENYDGINYSYFIYNSNDLNSIREFATNERLQIMVINIQAFNKDLESGGKKTGRILLDYNDKLGYTPITLLQNTRPVVIVDEPQKTISSDSGLGLKSVKNLKPLTILRYSATHKDKVNLVYKLDAIDAYNKQLVKQIEVASVRVENTAISSAFIRLLKVSNKKGFVATVELDVKDKDGAAKRVKKDIVPGKDLGQLTKLPQYVDLFIKEVYTAAGNEYVELSDDRIIKLGQAIGAVDETAIRRMQISKTIEEHLDKEILLNPKGIKVLSLFFIDAVKNYRKYDEEGNASNGEYAVIFEEEYKKLISKPKYQSLFSEIKDADSEASLVHDGYFSIDKKPKKSNTKEKFEAFKDSSNKSDDSDAYNLIMKDKEALLSFGTERKHKVRFIFSHSALREGWDNPNVFQICTLKESGGSEITRRQEIGRGLRLAVNQDGERVYGFEVNKLTVMASESYEEFVDKLQKEMEKETGIAFGLLQPHSFANVVLEMINGEAQYLGQELSESIFNHLLLKQYVDSKGKVQDLLREDLKNAAVEFPIDYPEHVSAQLISVLKQTAGKLEIKKHEDKKVVRVKEAVLDDPEFKKLWDRIKYKTTYSVNFDTEKLITACIRQISERLVVNRGILIYNKVDITMTKGGLNTVNEREGVGRIASEVTVLPDIVSYLQNETNLTRKSIVRILTNCTNLDMFKINPQKFIEGCIDIINEQMRMHIVDGIVYRKIGEDYVYSQELFKTEELTGYLKSNMIESKKSPYDYVVFDSQVECELAKEFEKNTNVKVYAKLPRWFRIDTPLGDYIPDWAVLFEIDGTEQLFFVVESKGTMSYDFLRPSEQGKIECGKAHFKELANKTNSNMKLIYVSDMEKFIDQAVSA